MVNKRRNKNHISYGAKRRIIFTVSVIILVVLYAFKNSSFFIRSASAIGSLVLFYIGDNLFDIRFTYKHYFYMTFIAITGFLLSPLYFIYPSYDKLLHFVLPLMMSSIVFFMISDLELKLKWKLTFTFFIVIGTLGLFEIGEFALDQAFDWKLQGVWQWDSSGIEKFDILQDRNDDTMIDLALGIISAGIYSVSMILFFKNRKKANI
jgi:hypothetical protein